MTPNGTAIRALREVQRLSIRKLAGLAGLSPSTLSRIESGDLGASHETLSRLAEVLSAPVQDLAHGDDVKAPVKQKNATREVPSPGTPEGEVFHYTPEEAARFLPWSELSLRRKAYAREVPFRKGGHRITFTGADIREISEGTAVRPSP